MLRRPLRRPRLLQPLAKVPAAYRPPPRRSRCAALAVLYAAACGVIHGVSVPFAWQVVRRNDDESTLLRVPLLRVPLQWQLLAARGAAQPPEAASLLQSLMQCSRSIL